MPWPDDLLRMVRDMEHELLTRKNDGPLLKDDPEGKKRAQELWALARPTMGAGFREAMDKALAAATKPLTEEEQLERISKIGHQPTQPTEALMRSLNNPMRSSTESEQ